MIGKLVLVSFLAASWMQHTGKAVVVIDIRDKMTMGFTCTSDAFVFVLTVRPEAAQRITGPREVRFLFADETATFRLNEVKGALAVQAGPAEMLFARFLNEDWVVANVMLDDGVAVSERFELGGEFAKAVAAPPQFRDCRDRLKLPGRET